MPVSHKIANNLLDITADITNFGKFGGFNLDEWCACQFCKATGNLGFSDAGWPNHQNILWHHLFFHRRCQLLTTPAVAHGDCDCTFGILLSDDVTVEFADDLTGREICVVHGQTISIFLHQGIRPQDCGWYTRRYRQQSSWPFRQYPEVWPWCRRAHALLPEHNCLLNQWP